MKSDPLSPAEVALRGDEIYERTVRAQVEAEHRGRIVAIDVNSEAFAVGDSASEATRRLRETQTGRDVWLVRVGHRSLHRIGFGAERGQP